MKLPEKKYEPKHNDELRSYAQGWNAIIIDTEYFCNKYGDEQTKKDLLEFKDYASKRQETPIFNGAYDCIVEIEKLNVEDTEARDVFDEMFSDSLEALDKLTIKNDELDKKLEELNKYNEDSQLRML